MICQWYLAMTSAEMHHLEALPGAVAWMACHFSPYGTGLSNLPSALPAGSMVILNDSTPIFGHDSEQIAGQLLEIVREQQVSAVLLDLQRPDCPEAPEIIERITQALPCPVAVTEIYGANTNCGVFLSPPLNQALEEAIKPWQKREIWLDIPLGSQAITGTCKGGSGSGHCAPEDGNYPHEDRALHCRYWIDASQDRVRFTLCRSADQLPALLDEAGKLGIPRAVGLYQEFNRPDEK